MSTTITPPNGWTDDPFHLEDDDYWADEPNTVRNGLEKDYGLSNLRPIWARNPSYGAVLFILEGRNSDNQLRYYLWNGLSDMLSQFVQETLQSIKYEINLGKDGSMKQVKFKDVE